MTTTFQNGEKMAKVGKDAGGFYMARGIVGDETENGFQVFGMKSYANEATATRAAQKWIAA
jgi:hypothetical protein